MAIAGYERAAFGEMLDSVVSPSQPVNTPENLFGRADELERIEKALYASGRHIFVFGDRGVGKSSLAATAAAQYQSSDANYIDVSCSPDSTFKTVVASVATQAANISRLYSTVQNSGKSLNLRYFTASSNESLSVKDLHQELRSTSDAVELLREVCAVHSKKPIVVVDEFDRISEQNERNAFADLLKQLGDKRVPIKFIFTGVAKTLDDLLGAHRSAIRQLETIELPRLSWNGRWDILLHAANAFDISVDREIYLRAAAVSDGFPYYVHLLTEKLLWQLFDDPNVVSEVTHEHYISALHDSIESISAELKRPYQIATNQKSDDYEEVLWATADSEYLTRYLQDMYSSYEFVMKQIGGKPALDYKRFAARVRSLKSQANGEILVSEVRPGLYSYKEKMLRGYVRMQAEAHGIELLGEEAKPTEKQYMHTPRTTTGYKHSNIPKGVHFGKRRKNDDGRT